MIHSGVLRSALMRHLCAVSCLTEGEPATRNVQTERGR